MDIERNPRPQSRKTRGRIGVAPHTKDTFDIVRTQKRERLPRRACLRKCRTRECTQGFVGDSLHRKQQALGKQRLVVKPLRLLPRLCAEVIEAMSECLQLFGNSLRNSEMSARAAACDEDLHHAVLVAQSVIAQMTGMPRFVSNVAASRSVVPVMMMSS